MLETRFRLTSLNHTMALAWTTIRLSLDARWMHRDQCVERY